MNVSSLLVLMLSSSWPAQLSLASPRMTKWLIRYVNAIVLPF